MDPDTSPAHDDRFEETTVREVEGDAQATQVTTKALILEVRRLGEKVARQGEALDRFSIAIAQQTAALNRLTDKLDPDRKGRDR